MFKARRVIWGTAGGLIILMVALAIVCLDSLEKTPLSDTAYYRDSTARWRVEAAKTKTVTGELSAGFGRALLTPVINAAEDEPGRGRFRALPLAGYGNRKSRPATGVRDDLFVKAAAFQVEDHLGVMVSADALIIPREVADAAMKQLQEQFALERAQVYFSATHTHSSFGGWGEGMVAEAFAGRFQPGVREWFAGRIVAAVTAALSDMAPASLGHGKFSAPETVRNRLVGKQGALDCEFSYVVVRQTAGKLVVLGSYAAHATVLSSRVMEFSGDYPGSWQRTIENATGGTALFLAGAMGSHSPMAGKAGFDGAEAMGEALARALLEDLAQLQLTNTITFGAAGLELTLPPLHARLTSGIRFRPWLAHRILPVSDRTFLQVFRLDDSIWLSTPCDFSGELALEIKEVAQGRGYQAVVTSFNGDYIGYVIPARYYNLGGYEPKLMSFHGPHLPDLMSELMLSMALHMAGSD
jgi:neutral ceramidase